MREEELLYSAEKELNKIGIELKEVVFLNPQKGRVSGIASHNKEELFFFKYNSDKYASHLKLLKKEIEVYKEIGNNSSYLPKVIFSSENLLLLEYVDGKRLREIIIQKNHIKKDVFEGFFQLIQCMQDEIRLDALEEEGIKKAIEKNINILIFSKPMHSPTYKFEKLFTSLILRLFRGKLKKKIIRIEKVVLEDKLLSKRTLTHGDLHLNNILVTENKFYLLDWENCRKSYLWLEVLFAYVQMVCLYDSEENIWLIDYCRENGYSEEIIINIKDFFLACVKTNRSFCGENFWTWLKSEFYLIKILIQS